MSFAAVQKHVAVLERAGLVTKERRGREQLVRTDAGAVGRARQALDELESAWHRTLLLAEHVSSSATDRVQSLVRSRLIALTKSEVEALGAGSHRPTFTQHTRQRRG